MFNSMDTSSGELNTLGCETGFPKFMDYHNQLPYVSNSPHCNNVKTPHLRNRLPDYTKEHIAAYEKQGINQFPPEIIDRKSILVTLNLSENKFEYFPLEILQIKTLKTLKMDYNKIKSIPSDIPQLASLETLSLAYNSLQFIPSAISKLVKLKELNLEHNILDSLPQEIGELTSLKALNILNNRLDSFPTSIGSITTLQEFSLEWFRYTDPKLSVHQRGYCSEHIIKKLLERCSDFQKNGIKSLSFELFIDMFSYSKRSFHAADDLGRTMLHAACLNQDISVIKYIIFHAPEVTDMPDKNSLTPLCLSLLEDRQKATHCLLKYGANVSQGGGTFGSPLHIAVKRINTMAVQKIVQRGEDTNKADIKGNTPLHFAADVMIERFDDGRRIAQQLLEHKADPNAKNKENWTPVHCMAKKRDVRAIAWAISYNLEVEEIHGGEEMFKLNKGGGNFNWTPMHIAAYVGSFEIVVQLGEAGVDMFKKSVNGYTPKAVITKQSLALKFLEKYEKKWVRKNVLHKRIVHPESLAFQNLTRFNNKKEISNASKNKFEGACLALYTNNPQDTSFNFNNTTTTTKNRVRMLSPLLGTGLILRRQDDDDESELTPESPTSFGEGPHAEEEADVEPSEGCDLIDFNSELNEGVNIGVDMYVKEAPLSSKKENKVIQANEASQKYFKKEKTLPFSQQTFDLENETYEARLKQVGNFDLNFCKTELRFLKDHLVLTKVSFTEKMKIFVAFRTLHKVILEHIQSAFKVKVSVDLIPYMALGNSRVVMKGGQKNIFEQSQNTNISVFYELVPQSLISSFMSLETQNFETAMNKLQIIRMLIDMKYYPALDFFQSIARNNGEAFWVKQEARNGCSSLTLSLGLDAKREKENQRY